MSKIVSLRLNADEEEQVINNMLLNNEDNINKHFKRVYFESLANNIDSNQSQLESIFLGVTYLREKMKDLGDADLTMKLLAGLYIMVRNSVDDKTRKIVDEQISVSAVQEYLEG